MLKAFLILLGFWAAGLAGWLYAHHAIAAECERLGGFFVNDRTYKCVKVERL